MTISAASQYKLRTLHRDDPSFLKNTLTDISKGDALALKALQERSGISSTAELQSAAATFMASSIDALFATGGDRNVMNTIGVSNSSFESERAAPQSRSSSILAARSQQVDYRGLKSSLLGAQAEIDALKKTGASLEKEVGATNTEMKSLDPNWRERNLNSFFARLTFADPAKAVTRRELEKKLEDLGEQITKNSGDISRASRGKRNSTIQHLKASGNKEFKTLDAQFQNARSVNSNLTDFRRDISSAISKIDSALHAERMEAANEAAHNRRDPGHAHANGRDPAREVLANLTSPYGPDASNKAADRAIKSVMSQLSSIQNEVNALLGNGTSFSAPTTTSGNTLDTLVDIVGHGTILGQIGSATVVSNLQEAKNEMTVLRREVVRTGDRIRRQVKSIADPRSELIEATMQKALAS